MAISSRTRLLTLGLSAILAVGIIGGATATFAHESGTNSDTPTAAAKIARRQAIGFTLRQIGLDCGLTKADLKTGFKNGESINDILTAKGQDPATCQASVLTSIKTKLDALVANGTIKQERADTAYAKAVEKLPVLMAKAPQRPHSAAPAPTN